MACASRTFTPQLCQGQTALPGSLGNLIFRAEMSEMSRRFPVWEPEPHSNLDFIFLMLVLLVESLTRLP